MEHEDQTLEATITPEAVPQPEWVPLPAESAHNVDGKVLLLSDDLVVAMLRLGLEATLEEEMGDGETEVVCLAGSGFTSIGGPAVPLARGQRVRWPAGTPRRLWTRDTEMMTLMIERRARS